MFKDFKHLVINIVLAILSIAILLTCFIETKTISNNKDAEYKDYLFDTSYVHDINVLIDDWDTFVENAADEEYVCGSIIIDDERYDNVAIRTKGNSSLKRAIEADNGRLSLKIEFDHYDDDINYHGLDKLSLNNTYSDPTYMKDYLAYYLMNKMDVPSSYCSYSFVKVNGNDLGLYIALESIEDSYLERYFGDKTDNILKPDDKHNQVVGVTTTSSASGTTSSSGSSSSSWLEEGEIEQATLAYIDDEIDSYEVLFNSARSDLSNKDKKRIIKSLKKLSTLKDLDEAIDIDEVINYMTVQCFLVNYDSYIGTRVHNFYLHVDSDGVMSMLPWDYNLSFRIRNKSSDSSAVVNCPLDNPYGEEIGTRPMFDWIEMMPAYKQQYHNQTIKLVEDYIESGILTDEIDRVSNMIDEYVKKDPTNWFDYDTFNESIVELKKLVILRGESLKQQVLGNVPSTLVEQEANPDKLIDASSVDVSKIGRSSKKD